MNWRVTINEGRNNEMDPESNRPRQEMIQNSEDLRSLLNTNSRENGEIAIEK